MDTHLRERRSGHADTVARDAPTAHRDRQTRGRGSAQRSSGLRRLSVIIPTFNEERTIGHTLDRVRGGSAWEVIVVDGRSTDRTREIARAYGATVVESPPGRGRQLAVGASIATGDTLLFLHADTSLPSGFDDYVFGALDQPGVCAGAFRLLIDGEGRSFRLIEKMVNFRSRARQMPYGDQAIFVRARVLHEAGGFPDLPIMEDYVLIRRLQRIGRVVIAPATVVTSARRWIDHGVWRTTLRNQVCIAAYRLGVSPARIARWREDAGAPRPATSTYRPVSNGSGRNTV
ncbi:MAG: TIGR04283 family arsenosugar biosynthesis glycosyltransferase [Planctomycetes bacterium]|nr:TIGR04283 family arsenosugar biosynthesis glycosyltransferase [Planctomycetota bacterium]